MNNFPFKLTLMLLVYFFSISSQARSIENLCKNDAPSDIEINKMKEKVRSNLVYKKLLKTTKNQIKIYAKPCTSKSGHIKVGGHHDIILNKKCWSGPMKFYFKIVNKKVIFNKLPFGKKKLKPQRFNHALIKASFKKVAQNPIATDFFKENNFCQVEYSDFQKKFFGIMQLRNKKGKVCYLKISLNGEKVEVIKRLYAKNSECQIKTHN